MTFDQRQFNTSMNQLIKEVQDQLREIQDAELIGVHESIYNSSEGELDAGFMAAAEDLSLFGGSGEDGLGPKPTKMGKP